MHEYYQLLYTNVTRISTIDIYLVYASYMLRICFVYTSYMLRICFVYTSYMLRIYLVYASYMLFICMPIHANIAPLSLSPDVSLYCIYWS